MARNPRKDPSINLGNRMCGVNKKRGMNKRAKRHSNKKDRQLLNRDLRNSTGT